MQTSIITFDTDSNTSEIANQVNKIRLANKNEWYQIEFRNESKNIKVGLKCFNTWVQLAHVPYFNNAMDMSPTEFKANISTGLQRLIDDIK